MARPRHRHRHDPPTGTESDSSDDGRRRHGRSRRNSDGKADKYGREKREREKRKKKHKSRKEEERRRPRRRRSSNRRRDTSESDSSSSSSEHESYADASPGIVPAVRDILLKFPDSADELPELLKMVDEGQAVDTRQISDQSMLKRLRRLFRALGLIEQDGGVFLLSPKSVPTLERVGHLIKSNAMNNGSRSGAGPSTLSVDDSGVAEQPREEAPAADNPSTSGRRRIIGPEMPSTELLAAAAKLADAEAELRDAELDVDNDLFIGPPPPALVAEAASANEAERFEEVSRIMGAEVDNAYDVLGVNHKMSMDNVKKRYWKLSLLVHPDKCSHPQAHQAFIILNKSFKELQDPEKKKITDDKIKRKEEKEAMEIELRALREAALWRRSQGICMEGDDMLLAEPEQPPKREEWMTTLPQERKPGISMHSVTSFSRTGKEGRGDTSAWTDTPLDKAQKAKMNYLEAYNKTKELAAEEDKKRTSTDAELVDQYNKSKRSVPLVQKVEEEADASRHKKKKAKETEKEEWVGQHPWKPWDREKDLVAGRQKVNFDSNSMSEGLSSRFSSGNFQRNFL